MNITRNSDHLKEALNKLMFNNNFILNILIQNRSYIKALIIATIDFLFNRGVAEEDFSSYQFIHIPNYFPLINEDLLKYFLELFLNLLNDYYYPKYNEIHKISIVFFQLDRKTRKYIQISEVCVIDFHVTESISVDDLYNNKKWYKSEINHSDEILI